MWTVDAQLQRKAVQSQILGAYDLEYLCKTLPVKTAFNDTYIYYEGNQYLIYPPTGMAYQLNGFATGFNDKFDGVSDNRMHVTFKNNAGIVRNGFLDKRGIFIFEFSQEEF